MDGFGRVQCEPNGVLNLNRCLPASLGELRLTRRFETLLAQEIELAFGFSDELSLELDGQVLLTGTNASKDFGSYDERGYVNLDAHSARLRLEPGVHQLAATLKVSEGFGWGLVLALRGEQVRLLPAEGITGAADS